MMPCQLAGHSGQPDAAVSPADSAVTSRTVIVVPHTCTALSMRLQSPEDLVELRVQNTARHLRARHVTDAARAVVTPNMLGLA